MFFFMPPSNYDAVMPTMNLYPMGLVLQTMDPIQLALKVPTEGCPGVEH